MAKARIHATKGRQTKKEFNNTINRVLLSLNLLFSVIILLKLYRII